MNFWTTLIKLLCFQSWICILVINRSMLKKLIYTRPHMRPHAPSSLSVHASVCVCLVSVSVSMSVSVPVAVSVRMSLERESMAMEVVKVSREE